MKSIFRIDLSASKFVDKLVQLRFFPVFFQLIMLGILGLLVVNGFGLGLDKAPDELMSFRKTNLTTLAVWGLWWPSMIVFTVIFGRVWCVVCPMELVNRAMDLVARKVGWKRAKIGKWLRAGWGIVAVYLILQLLVAGASLHRVPHFTAILLLVLIGGAALTGAIFRRQRSFCQTFCPAGALLSVYGRLTPLQLEARDISVCDDCADKDCIRAENRLRFDKRSCPSHLKPFARTASDGCVLCFQCAKVCPHENIGFGIVSKKAPIRQKTILKPFEAIFVMFALGFVSHEIIGEVKPLDKIFHIIPEWLSSWIPFAWAEAFWFLLLFPAIVWSSIALLAYLFGHRSGIRSLLLNAATGAAPIVALAHMAKAIAKLSSWSGYLPRALSDPNGTETFLLLADQAIAKPEKILELSIVGIFMFLASAFIAWHSFGWIKKLPQDSLIAARTALVFTSVLSLLVLGVWIAQ